jgi:membrane fusion protein (multidrug efflux system)
MKNSLCLSKSACLAGTVVNIPFVFSLIIALFITACEQPKPKVIPPPLTVDVTAVVEQDVPVSTEWVGTLDGMVNAQINAQVTGYLISQNYKEGDMVKKGQLMYQIDPRTFQATLDNALGTLAQQKAVLKTNQLSMNRIIRLLPEKAVSVLDRDNAVGAVASSQAQVLSAQAALESAKINLGFTKIYSPITGIAGLSNAQIGDLVGPGTTANELTVVSQVDPIRAYIGTSEQQYFKIMAENDDDYNKVKQNVPVTLKLANNEIYPYKGKFFFGDRQVDVATGTIKVAILFPNPKHLLRPGMYARISVTHTENGAMVIPQQAVIRLQTATQVAVVGNDKTIEFRNVTLGTTIGELIVIKEGLKSGESVVVNGTQKIKAGMKVNTKPFKSPKEIDFSNSSTRQAG